MNKLNITYNKNLTDSFNNGKAVWGDYLKICNKVDLKEKVDAVICSPPFANSIRFYMNNWMRLWLSGWESEDYKSADNIFLDMKQKNNFIIYRSFFDICNKVLKPNGKVILHLGKTDKIDMAEELALQASSSFSEIYRGNENVSLLEKHGIKDKGGTIEHQFLFLMKK